MISSSAARFHPLPAAAAAKTNISHRVVLLSGRTSTLDTGRPRGKNISLVQTDTQFYGVVFTTIGIDRCNLGHVKVGGGLHARALSAHLTKDEFGILNNNNTWPVPVAVCFEILRNSEHENAKFMLGYLQGKTVARR